METLLTEDGLASGVWPFDEYVYQTRRRFLLGPDASAGAYVLQITVKEKSAGGKSRAATQWIDFEITK